jgi:hypothetical protein
MNQYIITGGGENHNFGVLPPLFRDLGDYFHSMKGGGEITSNGNIALPMSLTLDSFSGGGATHHKTRDYQEINDDEVIKDELYDKLLELLHVKTDKKNSRKKRQHPINTNDDLSQQVKKHNKTRKHA